MKKALLPVVCILIAALLSSCSCAGSGSVTTAPADVTSPSPDGTAPVSEPADTSHDGTSPADGTEATEADTTEDITATPGTTAEATTDEATTEEITTAEVTAEEITTSEATTEEVTTAEVTTEEITTAEITTAGITTEAVTTPEATTEAVTVPEVTTAEVTTPEITTVPVTPEATSAESQPPEPYRLSGDTSAFSLTQKPVCDEYSLSVKLSYASFFNKAASTGFVLPGLEQYFVPQGMDRWDEAGVFLISGYFNPTTYSSASVLLAVDATTGQYTGEWVIKNKNGSAHTGHDGGVAVTADDIYLSTSSKLYRISLEQLKTVGNHGDLKIEEEISVPVRASYCNYSNGYLFVGEFSINGNASYTITGHEHGDYYAWTVAYRLGSDGRPEKNPAFVISTPERIQGFCMTDDGRIFMTRSYGRTNDSYLYITSSSPLSGSPAGTVKINKVDVPIYETGSFSSVKTVPMAEGCTWRDGKAWIIFESGAYYYRAYNPSSVSKNPTDVIWSFAP